MLILWLWQNRLNEMVPLCYSSTSNKIVYLIPQRSNEFDYTHPLSLVKEWTLNKWIWKASTTVSCKTVQAFCKLTWWLPQKRCLLVLKLLNTQLSSMTLFLFMNPRNTGEKSGSAVSKVRAYQRISFGITHWNLFAGGAFPGHGVAIEAHVFGPQLQQRRPLMVLWGGRPRVGVHHPFGRILPWRSPPIQLEKHENT